MAETINPMARIRLRLARLLAGPYAQVLASVRAQVDEQPGWTTLTGRPHDYDPPQIWELYQDALTAWRKNPLAWRIVAITTDYVVGDGLHLSSPNRALVRFLGEFWNHPKNRLALRLEAMSDELARSGDLFPVLFRNEQDGMSYLRFVTKDRIARIETAPNDWETELAYYERTETGEERRWLSPSHPDSPGDPAVMLHYAVNRPIGALLGEGDLTTMLPWLQRYSRMLEDRVRLHWAMRAFLWLVTVPTNAVPIKREQYRTPPEAGSIVVKDSAESWEAVTPSLRGADASHDLKAVRGMVDAGSGYPPHWRGEAADANLATAQAMQGPTERHLKRRQQYFAYMLQDMVYHAYHRGVQAGRGKELTTADYSRLFHAAAPDISRVDNESLARAAREMASALRELGQQIGEGRSPGFNRMALRMVLRFAGEPQTEEALEAILGEFGKSIQATENKEQSEGESKQSTGYYESSKEGVDIDGTYEGGVL